MRCASSASTFARRAAIESPSAATTVYVTVFASLHDDFDEHSSETTIATVEASSQTDEHSLSAADAVQASAEAVQASADAGHCAKLAEAPTSSAAADNSMFFIEKIQGEPSARSRHGRFESGVDRSTHEEHVSPIVEGAHTTSGQGQNPCGGAPRTSM